MIDPEIWTDERFAVLSEGEQVLFIALFSQADDEGRLEWSPAQIKYRCFPASQHFPNVFEDRKNILVRSGLAYEFQSNGRVYLILPGWFKTQKIERAALSKIPDPQDLSTNPALLHYFSDLLKVREYQRKSLKTSDGQKMSETFRECQPKEKLSKEKRKEENTPCSPPVFFDGLEPDVVAFIANAAGENKTGKISQGRDASLRRELAEIRAAFGDETFGAALRETNTKGVPNANYVKRVAESAQRRPRPSVVPPRVIHAYSEGRKVEFTRGVDEPKSWTDAPPPSAKRSEVWPEHRYLVLDDAS